MTAPTADTISGGHGCKRATHVTTSAAYTSGGTHDASAYAAPCVTTSTAKNTPGNVPSIAMTTNGTRFVSGRFSSQSANPTKTTSVTNPHDAIPSPSVRD